MADTKYEAGIDDEDRYREFSKKQDQTEQARNDISRAIQQLKNAEEKLPPGEEQQVRQIRQTLSPVMEQLNQRIPQQVMQQAGAKHAIKTRGQDQHEHRPGKSGQ